MRRKIVAGNWKLNGSLSLVSQLVKAMAPSATDACDVVLFPPAIYAQAVLEAAQNAVSVGVQNVSVWQSGAFTGEVSADMAKDVGCHYALIGHSERRQYFAETDACVRDKVARALESGLTAMICVGETLEERESGQANAVVEHQVREGLADVSGEEWSRIVVAYEPVWAIGTGKTATAADAQAMHAHIRSVLESMNAPAKNVSVLYGGSVKADNAAALFEEPDIDGGLIGGASLKADEFLSICRAAAGA